MSWAGPKYFEAKLDLVDANGVDPDEMARSLSRSSQSSSRVLDALRADRERETGRHDKGERDRERDMPLATSQIQAASLTLDHAAMAQMREMESRQDNSSAGSTSTTRRKNKLSSSAPLSSPRNIFHSNDSASQIQTQYPDPFKCHGDYCSLVTRPVGSLAIAPDKSTADHVMEKLFTSKELGIMRKSPNYNRMMDYAAGNGPGLAVVTQKSIILARKERRGLTLDRSEDVEDWKHYPITPRQNSAAALRSEIEQATSTATKAEREQAARTAQVDRDLKAEQVPNFPILCVIISGFSRYVGS
jgi:hypothetical protein